MKPGDAVSGYLWPGDVDWFCAPGDVDLGAKVEAMSEVKWKLELMDATGKRLEKLVVPETGGGVSVGPELGARCVKVSARPHDVAFDAPYRLELLPAR